MPWIYKTQPPCETPAHYKKPIVLYDDVLLGKEYIINYAKEKRKEANKLRDFALSVPYKDEARYQMKIFRAWDYVIKSWDTKTETSEEIAPFIDKAYNELEWAAGNDRLLHR